MTASIPVIVVTGKILDERERTVLPSDTIAILSKEHRSREEALTALRVAWQQAVVSA